MTSCLTRIRRWWASADPSGDPTRPHAVVRDGVPIVHEGPPGYPGPTEDDEDER
ncbi:MAG TPA: hypothetical protein VGO60_15900 [Iamia sp.]|jgi:hypothetical protein|nr:hypothetical protein [Iamia sp.]